MRSAPASDVAVPITVNPSLARRSAMALPIPSRLVGWGMRSYHTSKEEEIFDRERRKTGTGFVPFVRLNERVEEALLRLVSWYAEETHMLDFSLKVT